jgi:hypothetical protein
MADRNPQILEGSITDLGDDFPWCDACQSYHHVDNKTCLKKLYSHPCEKCNAPAKDKLNGVRLCPKCYKVEVDRLLGNAMDKDDLEAGNGTWTMTLSEAIKHARDVNNDDASPYCSLQHEQLAQWLEELQQRRELDDPLRARLGANLEAMYGDRVELAKKQDAVLKETIGKVIGKIIADEVERKVTATLEVIHATDRARWGIEQSAQSYQAMLMNAEQVMLNDQLVVAHMVQVITEHVAEEHWPTLVTEYRGMMSNPKSMNKELLELVLEEAKKAVFPCQS